MFFNYLYNCIETMLPANTIPLHRLQWSWITTDHAAFHLSVTGAEMYADEARGVLSAKCHVRYQAAFKHISAVCNVQDQSFLVQ